MNMSSLIALNMMNCGVGGGGVDEVSEAGGGMGGGGNCGMHYLIKLTALLRETRAPPPRSLVKVKLRDCFITPRYLYGSFRSMSFQ